MSDSNDVSDLFGILMKVLELYHPLALRWFLLGTHYRSPVNYSKRQLELASDRIFYLYQVGLLDSLYLVSESRIILCFSLALGKHKH
jgi:cysteinyl-tRNA synthetase